MEKKIVLVGPECTGKTTLAKKIAKAYKMTYVPEAARIWVDKNKREVRYSDVIKIAKLQIALEKKAHQKKKVILCDTDLLSTMVYSQFYFKKIPKTVKDLFKKHAGDMYFLVESNLPWVAETNQRAPKDPRKKQYALFKKTLKSLKINYAILKT
jgi:HTH-type transcriptional repressor of NAD biosynthesis genes